MNDKEKRDYELTVLMADEAEAPLLGDGVEVVHADGPKMVSLAYQIKKHASAFLRVYILRCVPAAAMALNVSLQSQRAIVRYLLITPPIRTSRRPAPGGFKEEPAEKIEKAVSRPPQPETITNQALEQALEKILENESINHEPQ